MDVSPLGLALFIVIAGTGQVYFSHKRRKIIKGIHEERKKLYQATEKLHRQV